ncbi:accessory factor UbiK family protein [Saccharibacter sp. 17.LH.SD]|uniref:accessory factor UbiK family protein n=1 Tax=Saccharibacter sp. 17.LH.SD TaxID=2689393 RepID=UPI00136A4A14|nr:accessory factor UbiK family protein [Saccharibacter sp. 17.LH.SD]MXV43684.1 accessory factor UbiK family protein [Saccharibacter sp. 17.LH.SD]
MVERPRFFDDISGLAGAAFSAAHGAREEINSLIRSRLDEVLQTLNLVRRDEFEAVQEMASRARQGQEKMEARLTELETRLNDLEQSLTDPAPKE